MTAYNCPLGKACCDGCNCLTTGGCIAKQNTSQASSITHDGMAAMKLSKEELVEMLIGKREHVGIILG